MEKWEGEGGKKVIAAARDEEEAQWWRLEMNERWGHERRYEHSENTHSPTLAPKIRSLPKPLAGLISGDWREQDMKSRWDVQPLAEWVGEVSERTWVGPKRPGINTDILNILFRDLMFNGCFKSIIIFTPRAHFVILTLNSGSLVPPWSQSCGSESWETFAECWLDRRLEVPGPAHPEKGPPDCPD